MDTMTPGIGEWTSAAIRESPATAAVQEGRAASPVPEGGASVAPSHTLLAVDGNSLLHRAYHAHAGSRFRLSDGSPAWAVRGLVSQLLAAVDRACADAVIVGFDDPDASIRRDAWPSYKAQRPDKLANLTAQLRTALDVLRSLGLTVAVPAGLEADDVLASAAAYAPTVGAQTVIVTSDRDAFALIDEHTRVLRIINGGVHASPMLDPHRLRILTGVGPRQYCDVAALRGDASDNLPGVPGIGARTAVRLIGEFGDARTLFDDVAAGADRVSQVFGPALARKLADPSSIEVWRHNREVMAMRRDVPLGLDLQSGVGVLPVAEPGVREVCGHLDLSAGRAVELLCSGESVRPPAPIDLTTTWQPPPSRVTSKFPPLRRPAYRQATLF